MANKVFWVGLLSLWALVAIFLGYAWASGIIYYMETETMIKIMVGSSVCVPILLAWEVYRVFKNSKM